MKREKNSPVDLQRKCLYQSPIPSKVAQNFSVKASV